MFRHISVPASWRASEDTSRAVSGLASEDIWANGYNVNLIALRPAGEDFLRAVSGSPGEDIWVAVEGLAGEDIWVTVLGLKG